MYLQYTNPAAYPPLEHSSRLLADTGWQILFLGVQIHKVEALQFPCHSRINVRMLPAAPVGLQQRFRYIFYCIWVIAWALFWRSRWVYVSEQLSCLPGLVLSFLPSVRVIYHEHDSPDQNVPNSAKNRLVVRLRRLLSQRASVTILPSRQRAELFACSTNPPQEPLVVWNCPCKDEVGPQRSSAEQGVLRVLYHGSIAPSRLPPTVIDALLLLPEGVRLIIVGYETAGHIGYVRKLLAHANRLGVGHRIEYKGPIPLRADLLAHVAICDVGLALMPLSGGDLNEQTMFSGPSNKVFDYLAMGTALLIADTLEWRSLYVEPGYALACNPNDPASIATALRWYLNHPDEMRAMGERGRQRVLAEWNYETQFAPVLRMLQSGPLFSESITRHQRV
jgi:glycosyltransferase involved in cell wall biosynthesis